MRDELIQGALAKLLVRDYCLTAQSFSIFRAAAPAHSDLCNADISVLPWCAIAIFTM
jgi:hypothetical protein